MEKSQENMTERDIFVKNNILMGEFTRYMVEHPQFAAKVPNGARVVLLPKDNPELCEINKQLAEKDLAPDQSIIYVHIERLAPQKSRLVHPQLELAKAV